MGLQGGEEVRDFVVPAHFCMFLSLFACWSCCVGANEVFTSYSKLIFIEVKVVALFSTEAMSTSVGVEDYNFEN